MIAIPPISSNFRNSQQVPFSHIDLPFTLDPLLTSHLHYITLKAVDTEHILQLVVGIGSNESVTIPVNKHLLVTF